MTFRKVAISVASFTIIAAVLQSASAQKGPTLPRGPAQQMQSTEGVSESDPAVVFATTSIKCGDTIYEVSNGSKDGACTTKEGKDGKPDDVECRDREGGYTSSATCAGGCGPSRGAGSCTIKAVK